MVSAGGCYHSKSMYICHFGFLGESRNEAVICVDVMSHRVVPLTNLLPFLPNLLIDREPRRECLTVVQLFDKGDVKLAELDSDSDSEHDCSHK